MGCQQSSGEYAKPVVCKPKSAKSSSLLLKAKAQAYSPGTPPALQAESSDDSDLDGQDASGNPPALQAESSDDSDLDGQDASCYDCEQPAGPQKLFTNGQKLEDKLVGVIVTIFEGSSYDEMFREVRPTTVPGERISTYSLACSDVGQLHTFLAAMASMPEGDSVWRCLVEDVRAVPSDSVVFNWECCQGCGDHAFPCSGGLRGFRTALPRMSTASPSATMQFMGFALRSGFTVMCSDFSLKSLIHEWSEEHLGPNPFLQVGTCDQRFCLEFVAAELQGEEVPQQLQVVGELCADKGKARVTALADTILYTVNPVRTATALYDLKVLTVVTDYFPDRREGPIQEEAKCVIGHGDTQRTGLAGHVTLTYAEGGQLVTSMGHWIELTRLDASVESLMRAAAHNFGTGEFTKIQREYQEKGSAEEQSLYVQEACLKLVTQSAPSRMKQRTKY